MFEGNRPKDGNTYYNERYLIHILLIGDPGIGKSKLIESIYENSPKAIKSNGAMLSTSNWKIFGFLDNS